MHVYQRDQRARAKDKPEVAYFAQRERERIKFVLNVSCIPMYNP